jgi:WD40 repeat protein
MINKYPYIASVSDKILLHNPENPNPLNSISAHKGRINACAWTHNAKYIATGGEDCVISITSAINMEPHMRMQDITGKNSPISSVDFSTNSLFVASGSQDGLIKIWDLKKQEKTIQFKGFNSSVTSVAWNKESLYLGGGSKLGEILIFDLNSTQLGSKFHSFKHENYSAIKKFKFSPQVNELFASCCSSGIVNIWSLNSHEDKKPIHSFNEHSKSCSSIAFSPFSEVLMCSVGQDGKINLYDLSKFKVSKSYGFDD